MFSKIKKWPEKQLNYSLALFETSSHQTVLILNRLLSSNRHYHEIDNVPALKLYKKDQ